MNNFPIFKPNSQDSAYIYHYTKLQGVTGILSERKLWMTNIRYLNDWMEGRYFYEPLLKRLSAETTQVDKLNDIYEKCLNNTYIASFSKKPDLLSQYKYYGNICIAFDPLELQESRRELNNNPTSGFEVGMPVYYNSIDEYEEVISRFATDENLIENVLNEDIHALLSFFCFVGLVKHPGFSEESETRISHFWYSPQEVKYRFAGERRVPYIEFNFRPIDINKIIVGPGKAQKEIAFDLNVFKQNNGEFEHVDIYLSEIPFIPS